MGWFAQQPEASALTGVGARGSGRVTPFEREPDVRGVELGPTRMRDHRTTARGALLLTLLATLSLAAAAASPALNAPRRRPSGGSEPIVFPIVGAAKYFDDWGAPRGQGRHAGNDIVTTWRSPAVAAEDGKIKFWTTSPRAGCMLYLYGASGTTYLYIHLNNDLTAKRDNRGKCVPGVAYANGPQERRPGQGRAADRLQRRLRRRRGHLPPPLRGAPERRRRRRPVPVPERGDPAAVPVAGQRRRAWSRSGSRARRSRPEQACSSSP